MHTAPSLTLVFPIYNEEKSLPLLFQALEKSAKNFPTKTQIIFVNDGSTDNTAEILNSQKLPFSVVVITFSRNFGHQAAVLAGLEKSTGEITVSLDSDLQHPLSLIPEMLEQHKKGVDIVLTQRIDGKETSLIKKQSASFFYSLINSISAQKINQNSSDFRSLNRKALDSLLLLPEKRKFLRGMVQWIGFTTVILPFKVNARVEGTSKYTFAKMTKLALDGITSFTTVPLYASAFFGLALFVLAFIYAVYVIYIRFFQGNAVEGWASVLFVQLVVGGFLSLFLGLIGLYIAAIYDEVKERPNYIIKEIHENS